MRSLTPINATPPHERAPCQTFPDAARAPPSVSLEHIFWQEFRRIARERGIALNALAAEIDAARGDVGLASAIRVFVLQAALQQDQHDPTRLP